MKFRNLIVALCCLLVIPLCVVADSYSTYELTADTQILTKAGALCSLLIMTDGSNNATVILYDISAAADLAVTNKLVEITVKGGDYYGGRIWSEPVRFTEGLYADVTGTGASYIVEWKKL